MTHIHVSDELLKALDEVVGRRDRNRFLEEAARENLGRLELAEAIVATKGIAKGPGYEHWKDREATREWVNNVRGRVQDLSQPLAKPTTGHIAIKVINHYGDEVLKIYDI